MSMPFTPIARPPNTQNCEDGIYSGTLPSQICNPNVICDQVCIDVVLEADGAFPQWYVDGAVDIELLTYVVAGTPVIAWAISAGALPAGLALVGNQVTGTVTAGASTGTVTFTATNCEAGTDDITLTWDVNACTPASDIEPAPGDIPQPVIGTDYEVQFTATGTAPIVWTIDPLPPGATFTTDGLLTIPGASVTDDELEFTVTATGPCGDPVSEDYTIQGTEAITLRYGQLLFAGLPDPPPTFVETDFTGGGPLFADYTEVDALAAITRVGDYIFPETEGARQVMWIADSLLAGSETFMVGGFPWGITPGPHTASQSLTILGVPGKIFITSDQNGGTYTVTVT